MIVYDCEIVRCIPPDEGQIDPRFKYCAGWHDLENMHLSVICAYDLNTKLHHVYLEDNRASFQGLVDMAKEDGIIGFNSRQFDDQLCAVNGIDVFTTHDLLRQIRHCSGQPRDYEKGLTRRGYSLKEVCQANLGITKAGEGQEAPRLWQLGQRGRVIDYCLRDVSLVAQLWEKEFLIDPTNGEELYLHGEPWDD